MVLILRRLYESRHELILRHLYKIRQVGLILRHLYESRHTGLILLRLYECRHEVLILRHLFERRHALMLRHLYVGLVLFQVADRLGESVPP